MAHSWTDFFNFFGVALLVIIFSLNDPIQTLLRFSPGSRLRSASSSLLANPNPTFNILPQVCTESGPPMDKLYDFLWDLRQFTDFANELHKLDPGLEETIFPINVQGKQADGRHNLDLSRMISRLLKPALGRMSREVLPTVELAVASSNALTGQMRSTREIYSNSSGIYFRLSDLGELQRLDEAVSTNLKMYWIIPSSLQPHGDHAYRIIHLLEEYLENLAAILSPPLACRSDIQWNPNHGRLGLGFWAARVLTALGFETNISKFIQECYQRELLEIVRDLMGSTHNLRGHLVDLISDIKGLGDESMDFLLGKMGYPIPISQYINIVSTLACHGSSIRDMLQVLV